jgi:predicted DCC family thiol-disulfide oxidoreductase YuxK
MTEQVTVWFDSQCPLCRREIALMRRLDRRGAIRFVDACDPATACPLDRADILSHFHAEEAGRLLSEQRHSPRCGGPSRCFARSA